MSILLIFTRLLRKLIRVIISFILVSNPLMAADNYNFNFTNDDPPFTLHDDKVCYGKFCIGPSNEKNVPDILEKTNKFGRRERTDSWSTNDFDHSNGSEFGASMSIDI